MTEIRINEIFVSLSGEVDGWDNTGGLATFIRFQGCNLECPYCDTPQSRERTGGKGMSVREITDKIQTEYVVITGGEPLVQPQGFLSLTDQLLNTGHKITVETNGTYHLPFHSVTRYKFLFASNLRWVVDYKLHLFRTRLSNIQRAIYRSLSAGDVIKFVVREMTEYETVKEIIGMFPDWQARKVISPVDPWRHKSWVRELATTLVNDRLEGVTISLQLHKLLGLR